MSELSNPLFDNQREFLERQKEEYKNALMGDVEQIKSQGQEIGKKVAVAGGVLLAGYLLRRIFGGNKKGKSVKKSASESPYTTPVSAGVNSYDSLVHEQEDAYTLDSEREDIKQTKKASEKSKSFMQSDVAKFITQQAVALLLVYISKKAEEFIKSDSENNDIAATPVPVVVTEPETTTIIVPDPNAL